MCVSYSEQKGSTWSSHLCCTFVHGAIEFGDLAQCPPSEPIVVMFLLDVSSRYCSRVSHQLPLWRWVHAVVARTCVPVLLNILEVSRTSSVCCWVSMMWFSLEHGYALLYECGSVQTFQTTLYDAIIGQCSQDVIVCCDCVSMLKLTCGKHVSFFQQCFKVDGTSSCVVSPSTWTQHSIFDEAAYSARGSLLWLRPLLFTWLPILLFMCRKRQVSDLPLLTRNNSATPHGYSV